MAKDTDTPKKQKQKGPIRYEAIVPVVIILALIALYFSLFFDAHLKRGLEWAASYIHGAEVNIADIDTSFTAASFTLSGLQVTDKEQPTRNLFTVGEVNFELLWDALLRAKLVVEDASINQVAALVPRKSPGWVRPPEAEAKDSPIRKLEEGILGQAREEYEQNIIGDLANIAGGVDPSEQLKKIKAELKAEARIGELQKELDQKEALWKERIDKLPTKKAIEDLERRMNALKFNTGNPVQFTKDLKEADAIFKEADQRIKAIEKSAQAIETDVASIEKDIKQIEEYVQKDIEDLQNRLDIPDLDVADFSKKLFGRMFFDKLVTFRKYAAIARQYMPPKKTEEQKLKEQEEAILPRERGEGEFYEFPITTSYPLFWLKNAQISSKATAEGFSGDVTGRIVNVTTNPTALGLPAEASLAGDFPNQSLTGLKAKITVDHTGDIPKESLEASIAAFPIDERSLSNSEDVTFGWKKAISSVNVRGFLEEGQLDVQTEHRIHNIDYAVAAQSPLVQEILQGVAQSVPVVTINAKANGRWDALRWRLNSNLGQAIVNAFKEQVQVQIEKAKAQLKAEVEQRIAEERAKLTAEFNKVQKQVTGVVEEKKAELEKAEQQARAEVEKKKKEAQGSAKKQLKKEGKKLLKGLGF